jgi:GNAT superfamily N-acetyltransferase
MSELSHAPTVFDSKNVNRNPKVASMETQVRTPQLIFMQPQRLTVPLFQRPYVWNEENQWEPLWNDIARMTERLLAAPFAKRHPHFLGAVVLQQVQNPSGSMQERTIIDGQQRLTTLQLMFDSLHAELVAVGATAPSMRLETLIVNAAPFCSQPEDRFKVWPTNRDRPAFNAVMSASEPVDYDAVGYTEERMVQAHRYFSERAREWLNSEGADKALSRANAIETVVRELLQVVVIDLGADENAQEIFETLNARGAQLTAADLIKNFIFQRLLETGADVEAAYEKYWKEFESAFWETEISVGRMRYPRSSIFLNHWLVAQTGEEVVAREVFTRFKRFAMDAGLPMETLLKQLNRSSKVYRDFVLSGVAQGSTIDRLGLFSYRTGVLESEVVKPLLVNLLDPELPSIPKDQFEKALCVIESWMVRRMLVRATTKSYNQIFAELVRFLRGKDRSEVGKLIEEFFANQSTGSRYWPDDNEIREELRVLPAYRRLGRGRLRMVIEAIEDHLRGWIGGQASLSNERVMRGKFAIEHVMPRKWQTHWALPEGSRAEGEREALLHTLGNLTLLTSRLNSKVSNGPWKGDAGKKQALEDHCVLLLNRKLKELAVDDWTEAKIRARTDSLGKLIIDIWPVPEGHKSAFNAEKVRPSHRVDLSDLISAGCLHVGMTLTPRRKKFMSKTATLLGDGRVDIEGAVYSSVSEAAKTLTGANVSGWWFFLVDKQAKKSLRDVRIEYLESIAAEPDIDDDETDDDDD